MDSVHSQRPGLPGDDNTERSDAVDKPRQTSASASSQWE